MALVKNPTMTEKKIAANRRNGSKSRGPATEGGKGGIVAAHLSHGFYAQNGEAALSHLGEEPAEFEELLAGLREEFTPTGALEYRLVNRLARVLWLSDRADRSLEGDALRRARTAEIGRDNRLHARMMRLKMTAETLRSLARAVACWHYVTPQDDLATMKKLHHEGVAGEMGEIAMDLFSQLQEPGTGEDGISENEKRLGVVNSIRSIFGVGSIETPVAMLIPSGDQIVVYPEGFQESGESVADDGEEDAEKDDRYPRITPDDWKAREQGRKLLRNILSRQVEVCETQRKALLRESLAGPTPYELAAEIAPGHAEALLMRRLQDANMREVRRLTNLLLKIKRREGKAEAIPKAVRR
jgi:hypothetical protein